MRTKKIVGTSFLVMALAGSALAQNRALGPEVGLYFPSDSNLRAALGDSWVSFGIGAMDSGSLASQVLGTNWNFISQSKNGNTVFIATYTIGTFINLSGGGNGYRSNQAAVPYFAVRGGASYIDYAIGTPGLNRVGGKKIGYNANAEVGIRFNGNLTLSARYDIFSKHDGFTFDGLSFQIQYGLAKF